MSLKLRPLALEDETAARSAHAEGGHQEFLLNFSDELSWAAYLEQLENERRGRELAEGRVPAAFLAAVVDDELVGRVSIRYALNDYLAYAGGHIGYQVRTEHRRRGYGTTILRLALEHATDQGVERVLLTCDDANLGSQKIIESCGGVLESVVVGNETGGEAFRRYWIEPSATKKF